MIDKRENDPSFDAFREKTAHYDDLNTDLLIGKIRRIAKSKGLTIEDLEGTSEDELRAAYQTFQEVDLLPELERIVDEHNKR